MRTPPACASSVISRTGPPKTVDLLGAALKDHPRAADALCNHGLMLQHLGRDEEALASFDKALAVRPNDIAALHSRGLICAALGRHAEAVMSYDRVLAIQPADAEAHNNRGVALSALGRHADALASYDKALAVRTGLRAGAVQPGPRA